MPRRLTRISIFVMDDPPRDRSLAERLAAPGSRVPALDRTAGEVMTPGVVALPVTAPLDQAARAMAAHRVHGLLVVSSEGRPCGWVTSDLVMKHIGSAHLLDWAVDAIGQEFVTVRPSASVREVMATLTQSGVSRVAVQERPQEMPQGVITDLDLAGLMGS